MIQYKNLNIHLPDSQLNNLKLGIRNWTKVTLKLLSSVVSDFNAKNNFSHQMLLTNKYV